MNKKILIGSLVAVVILILVSFTGVVGYQTTKSSIITKASPLFTVRSSRAIDEDSKGLSCDYVGKGEEINIPFTVRDSKALLIQKLINKIRKMDEMEIKSLNEKLMNFIEKEKVSIQHHGKSPIKSITADLTPVECILVILLLIMIAVPLVILIIIGELAAIGTIILWSMVIPGCVSFGCPM